jgi:hypothetical protein
VTKKKASKPEIKQITLMRLGDLNADPENPRFGMQAGAFADQTQLVDHIVSQYGVDDVLSSIAVNGYFQSEPLLVKKKNGKWFVAEGNRRFTACLILAGDSRARNQKKRISEYKSVRERHGNKPVDPVPVVQFESRGDLRDLLPYLGVRHIAGAQEWDSFAKAAWVAEAVNTGKIPIEDVIHMIGDHSNLAKRMLQGYYMVQQLVEGGYFDPSQSKRKGVRSESEFPFSWVYTAISYTTISKWLNLPSEPKKNPVPKAGLENASYVFTESLLTV